MFSNDSNTNSEVAILFNDIWPAMEKFSSQPHLDAAKEHASHAEQAK